MDLLYRIEYRIMHSIMAESPSKPGLMRSVASEHWQTCGAELRSLRKAKGLGLRQFAREIPLTSGYACNLEYGLVAPPSVPVIYRMAGVLDIPANHLLAIAGKLQPSTMLAFWDHPAIPPILSTIPGMSLEDGGFCPTPQKGTFQQYAPLMLRSAFA
jgi:transcriptional regulator with XRE-family HTH domain